MFALVRNRVLMALFGLVVTALSAAAQEFAEERRNMVSEIRLIAAYVGPVAGSSEIDGRVLDVMERLPRHLFVPEDQRRYAYEDRPLPIGHGQTISQPYIVALMSDLLDLDGDETVLEVGTGSGYQAAILGHLAARAYTIEIVPSLAQKAGEVLERLGYDTVSGRQGDGYFGWEEHAPYDAIVVTAVASHVPPPLIRQLKPGGIMVIPVGNPFLTQSLMLVRKGDDGSIKTRHLLPVRFVPLTGDH